jgi:heme/copper-type cytochrome/quinol oxidase subunit 3|tara:strand:- start:3472 stop:4080 length:609 start_codon:yes stop_codon:yes gene_type:complete
MSDTSATSHVAPKAYRSSPLPDLKLFMWLFLASDCMFFGTLIGTYLVYRGRSLQGPFPIDVLDIPITTVSSFVLLMSSFLMVLALHALRSGNIPRFRLWTFGVAFFGAIFLGFQVFEFSTFVQEGLTLNQNLFGSTFFVLTGTHGIHVTIGVLMLLSILILSYVKPMTSKDSLFLEVTGLYWHFVDIVWIVIFTVIYLVEFA